jgi:hypothetical protein
MDAASGTGERHPHALGEDPVSAIPIQPIVALVVGILILIRPALLSYLVAAYLIVIGVLGLLRL